MAIDNTTDIELSQLSTGPLPSLDEHTTPEDQTDSPALQGHPLAGMNHDQLVADARRFVREQDMENHGASFEKGALLAKAQNDFEKSPELSDRDREMLRFENTHKWRSSPARLYLQCALCAGCAIVQGMDQTVINGAQEFYFEDFGITDPKLKGLVNGSPYVAAALIGCWLNHPLNKYFGRRGTIFFSCVIALVTAIWQAAAPNWHHFLAARFLLGLAVGAKSSTTPVYAAECAPANIRGALVMMWQMFTAFGIMLGYSVSLGFQHCDTFGENSQWRWMMGVTAFPPLVVCILVYLLPESPRWYMERGEHAKAFNSMRKLRKNDVLAARDTYLAVKNLNAEETGATGGKSMLREFFTVRRNLRAAQSSFFCMFMQQFCGVNVIAYYSTRIFMEAGYSRPNALAVSMGCGVANFLFALPAVWTIDTFGRRKLLLTTFPFLATCLFWAAGSFHIPRTEPRVASVVSSLYAFMVFYSPGMGPVPFTYSAEAFPLSVRAFGMAAATSITWAFNFVINFSWPSMMGAMSPTGGFIFYGTWNVVAWVFTYFLLPETKGLALEELDNVFAMRNHEHAGWHWRNLKRLWGKLLGKDVEPMPPLYKPCVHVKKRVVNSSSEEAVVETVEGGNPRQTWH